MAPLSTGYQINVPKYESQNIVIKVHTFICPVFLSVAQLFYNNACGHTLE